MNNNSGHFVCLNSNFGCFYSMNGNFGCFFIGKIGRFVWLIRSDKPIQRGEAWKKSLQVMPFQVPPVVAAVAVPGAPLVGNPNILVLWANIVVYKIDKEDSIQQIFTKADLS